VINSIVRPSGRLLALFVLALVVLVPGTAWGHSSVSGTTPADGDTLATAPGQYVMTFNEQVTVPDGFFRIVDATGNLTPLNGVVTTPKENGTVASVDLPVGLNGWYALGWKAISADGHEIEGTVSFVVGADNRTAEAETGAVEKLRQDPLADLRRAGTALRALNYTTSLLAVGALGFLFALRRARRNGGVDDGIEAPTVRIASIAAVLGALAAPAALAVNTLLLNGGDTDGIGTAFSIQVGTPVGLAQLIRVSAFFAMCTAVLLIVERGTRIFGVGIGAAAGIALVTSYSLSGHATIVPGDNVAAVALVAHLGAGALWLGAVPALALTLRRAKSSPKAVAALTDAFSTIATVSVLVLFPAAVVLSWNMFTSPAELWETAYGIRLLGKFAVVATIGAIGAYNHFVLVPALRQDPDRYSSRIRASVTVESIGLALVIAATTLLTDQGAPAAGGSHVAHLGTVTQSPQNPAVSQEIADNTPTIARAPFGDGEVEVTVLPARAGVPNDLTIVFIGKDGQRSELEGPVTVAVTVPGSGLAPLQRSANRAENGEWVLTVNDFGYAGTWDVTVTGRAAALSTNEGTVVIPVKPAAVANQNTAPSRDMNTSTGGTR
jgi:copper transport protein